MDVCFCWIPQAAVFPAQPSVFVPGFVEVVPRFVDAFDRCVTQRPPVRRLSIRRDLRPVPGWTTPFSGFWNVTELIFIDRFYTKKARFIETLIKFYVSMYSFRSAKCNVNSRWRDVRRIF